MKNNLLNYRLLLFIGITLVVFGGCDKDDPFSGDDATKIKASKVENSNNKISKVKIFADYPYSNEKIAETSYQNDGFTLSLPKMLPFKYLSGLSVWSVDVFSHFEVDNKDALIFIIEDILAYDANDKYIGDFYLEYITKDEEYYMDWIYADSNVKIKGTYDYLYPPFYKTQKTYDLNLKKGWNVAHYFNYMDRDNKIIYKSVKSNKPTEINYAWKYYNYDSYYSSNGNKKDVFSVFRSK